MDHSIDRPGAHRPGTHRPGRYPVKWLLPVLLVVATVAFALMRVLARERVVSVRIVSPQMLSMNTSVLSNGRVLPVEDFQARAAFAGTVDRVVVHVGDKVHAGSLLVTMNDAFAPSRYASATAALQAVEVGDDNIRHKGSQEDRIAMQGDLQRDQMAKADAEKELAMMQTLAKSGAASQGEIENAQHRLTSANETLNSLRDRMSNRYSDKEVTASRGRVAEARAALQTARSVLANARIVSPIAGTVYSLPVAASDFVPMGAELMRVTDLTKVQVHAYIDEPEIGQLALNEPVIVTWGAKPGRQWHGFVSQVPLTVSSMGTRIVGECVITISDADGTLLPNTNVSVTITTSASRRALTIPRAALHIEGSDKFVFRVVAGRLKRTSVQTGLVGLDQVQVNSGLSAEDVVAVTSATLGDLSDGLSVKPIP